ncbi:penicillin-binding transpeptidase domain-containing protein [Oceanirhabdus sp. W0125-5]|uniref:penicillin-binding transpeptidase domain-containing protein n=1 Tax=Oceanirhabdus sp. W0125-5 TaxID=2999116 RepID=UPI0022F33A8B|nr:penicillin-binding transpeptidase domain-containing protein [Oceanirhabdus sp. W0125-5]WBW95884.1 penicillin-binding transpeptidase domain-containing protein [Oceanirhabdus sp. W0125-5]
MKSAIHEKVGHGRENYKENYKVRKKKKELKRIKVYTRYYTIYAVFALLIGYVTFNTFRIMLLDKHDISTKMIYHGVRKKKIMADRGEIFDRNGKMIASNYKVYRLEVDMRTLKKRADSKEIDIKEIIYTMADILEMDKEVLYKKLMKEYDGELTQGTIIKGKVEEDKVEKIKALMKNNELHGYGMLYFDDNKRFYGYESLGAQMIGHVNPQGNGLNGVELYYDDILKGVDGIKLYNIDKNGYLLPTEETIETEAIKGKDIYMTIDTVLQNIIEKIAQDALIDNKAKKISIMVMDPNTGEILALANKPDYNLNDPMPFQNFDENMELWKNRAVNDSFEPGSIFKPFTTYAGLKEGVINQTEMMDTKGYVYVNGAKLWNWDKAPHKNQTLQDALIKSSNTFFVEIAQRLGKEKMMEYIDLFGFGKKVEVDLPGESSGIVMSLDTMREVDLATISFGQTNTLTMVQFMRAFNALVNGGYLKTPHVVKEIKHDDIIEKPKADKVVEEPVLDPAICRQVTNMLENVIAKSGAFIEGYHIAGKTGTAQKPDYVKGGYKDGAYISSLAAAAPADNPQVSILISVDEPGGDYYYAGTIITPIAKKVFLETFKYLSITNDEIMNVILNTLNLPDIESKTTEEGIKVLVENGLNYEQIGSGKYVSHTIPEKGTLVEKGRVVKVYTFD